MSNLKQTLTRNLLNIPGWCTTRKIMVIESDDWGSIRMPSREVYESLLKKGIAVNNLSYNRFDSLASEDDLSSLFDVLSSVKDKSGNSAVLTANTVMANPDFDRIKQAEYRQYFYEPFTETLKSYPEHSNSFQLWKEGMYAGIFRPQFHGREHVNVNRWLRALQQNTSNVRLAFDNRMFDLSTSLIIGENSFMESLNYESTSELEDQKKALSEGLDLFEKIFGYRSTTFIAPCYTWSSELNKHLSDEGVKAWQGAWFQQEPLPGVEHKFKKRFHYLGQKNKAGQYYLVRNAYFEPADNPNFNWVGDVLERANVAFRWGKPFIISSHRLNYIGYIDQKNRNHNLPLLKKMLNQLLFKWPDIEFMSSDQLVDLMNKKG